MCRSGHSKKDKTNSRTKRAGLLLPVELTHRNLRKEFYGESISTLGPVYLTAVLEYLSAEVLSLAHNAARDEKKSRIEPRHINLAIRNDQELRKFLSCVMIRYSLRLDLSSGGKRGRI